MNEKINTQMTSNDDEDDKPVPALKPWIVEGRGIELGPARGRGLPIPC